MKLANEIPSVNFHLWKPCNMKCEFCFATFRDVDQDVLPRGHLPREDCLTLVETLAGAGFDKINFAGGEPTLCPWLPDLIRRAKELAFTTSIVTNASRITPEWLDRLGSTLDWAALSIDTVDPQKLVASGRSTRDGPLSGADYLGIIDMLKERRIRLKINTVVTQVNCDEDLTDFIARARPEVMPRLPTSGQIIGALVTRLGISLPVQQRRNAHRYFAADPEHLVKDTTRAEIIDAIAEVLTDAGFISLPQARESNCESAPALSAVLQWHTDNWDLMRSSVRRRTASVLPSHIPKVWEAYVRLAVIDLALRVAAHLHLAGKSPTALEPLNWASVDVRGEFLNRKRRQTPLTLEDLAEALDVTDHTVDAWMYDGARPSNDNLAKLAETLAEHIEGTDTASIALELRALYWVSDVAALLAEHIGAAAVDEVVGRLRKYAEEAYCIIGDRFPAEDRPGDLIVLADLGVGARGAAPLLSALIEREPDGEWREDLRSTGLRWINRVISANMSAHLAAVDDLIQETEGRLLEDWDVSNPEAYAHYRRSMELQAQGKLHEALAEVEIAARLDPLDPANHFTLGSVKTSIGIGRGDVDLVNEGLDALWLAVTLDPSWVLPWTEIGSTLYYTDRPEEAVAHLRSVKPECGPLDSYYLCTLGTAEWKLDELPRALAAFEAALELDPEETSALLAASELALPGPGTVVAGR